MRLFAPSYAPSVGLPLSWFGPGTTRVSATLLKSRILELTEVCDIRTSTKFDTVTNLLYSMFSPTAPCCSPSFHTAGEPTALRPSSLRVRTRRSVIIPSPTGIRLCIKIYPAWYIHAEGALYRLTPYLNTCQIVFRTGRSTVLNPVPAVQGPWPMLWIKAIVEIRWVTSWLAVGVCQSARGICWRPPCPWHRL